MDPQQGQYIKVTFRDHGVQLEGTVESWGPEVSVLRSLDGQRFRVIYHTKQDVMYYEIVPSCVSPAQAPQKLQELSQQFEEVYQQPTMSNDLRTQSLAKLRIAMAEQEKQIVANKLKPHYANLGGAGLTQYGSIFTK